MIKFNNYIPLSQKVNKMYLIKMTIEELLNHSSVQIFNPTTGEGYQRPPIPSHYKKIAKYLANENSPLLPLGVLTAVNSSQIHLNNCLEIEGQLRIVDGQHRIEGFRYLKEINNIKYEQYKDFEFPVTVLVIEEGHEVEEMDAFININNKAKKLSTDLAIHLSNSIRNRNSNYERDLEEVTTDIAVEISKILNNDSKSIWFKAIRQRPDHSETIISTNAFIKSLIPIIELFIKYVINERNDLSEEELTSILVEDEEGLVKYIGYIVDDIWDIVTHKWSECFNRKKPYFDKYYNIQKGIGLFSIHIVFQKCVEKAGSFEQGRRRFKEVINETSIESYAWRSGGDFSGYNSKVGFKNVANIILTHNKLAE